jgi:hypothetical protein
VWKAIFGSFFLSFLSQAFWFNGVDTINVLHQWQVKDWRSPRSCSGVTGGTALKFGVHKGDYEAVNRSHQHRRDKLIKTI